MTYAVRRPISGDNGWSCTSKKRAIGDRFSSSSLFVTPPLSLSFRGRMPSVA